MMCHDARLHAAKMRGVDVGFRASSASCLDRNEHSPCRAVADTQGNRHHVRSDHQMERYVPSLRLATGTGMLALQLATARSRALRSHRSTV